MEIIGTFLLIILALCAVAAAVFIAGPYIIIASACLWARLSATIEEKIDEWCEIIDAAKGGPKE